VSLMIPCGNCGPRPVEEFRFGDEVVERPATPDPEGERLVDDAWMLTNAEGPNVERWFHAGGCRRWVTIKRDTRTDRVLGGDPD
jgi:sarcosine oxidase subunit delta